MTNGVNFLVGDNNSGKSTVLQAILFLFEGPSALRWTPDDFYTKHSEGPTRVQVDIAGGVQELVQEEKFKKLRDFVFEDRGLQILRLERSSQEREVQQGGKLKRVDVKSVCFWHPGRGQFENVTGIDALVKGLIDFEAVWADARPSDTIDFSSTKTLGRLLESSFQRFVETEIWAELVAAHSKAFTSNEGGSFLTEVAELAAGIKSFVDDQYGTADLRFDFGLPDASVFMKQGQLQVDDGAGETPIEGKGTGMQRAVALAIIQMYAKSVASADDSGLKPLVLMLDEPETWLHPSAQLKLGDALCRIGEHDQVFVITHSPYLIRKFNPDRHLLTVMSGHGNRRECRTSTKFGLFGMGEPTWGEINYRAFEVCSNDFHNELYGHIQHYLIAKCGGASEGRTDDFLVARGIARDCEWKRDSGSSSARTLPVYVRNSIHHPENRENQPVTKEQLRKSTELLIRVVEWINGEEQDNAG